MFLSAKGKQMRAQNKRLEKELNELKELEQQMFTPKKNNLQ